MFCVHVISFRLSLDVFFRVILVYLSFCWVSLKNGRVVIWVSVFPWFWDWIVLSFIDSLLSTMIVCFPITIWWQRIFPTLLQSVLSSHPLESTVPQITSFPFHIRVWFGRDDSHNIIWQFTIALWIGLRVTLLHLLRTIAL